MMSSLRCLLRLLAVVWMVGATAVAGLAVAAWCAVVPTTDPARLPDLPVALRAPLDRAAAAWPLAWRLPRRYNPFATLDPVAKPNWATRAQWRRALASPAACARAIEELGWRVTPLPDRITGPGCAIEQAFRIERSDVGVGTAFVASCPLALSLAMWERHTLQPSAMQAYGEPVRELHHYGSYSCRNIYGRERGPRSRHATADALDVAGFTLQSGRRVLLRRGWTVGADAAFLRDIHAGACHWFDGVLGPDFNAAHADHFHFEVHREHGGPRVCR